MRKKTFISFILPVIKIYLLTIFKQPKTTAYCLFLTLFCTKIFAQEADTVVVRYPDSLRAKLSYAINWDARSSFVANKRVNIWGVNSGITVGRKRNQITVGYYWMNFNSYLRLLDLRKNTAKRVNLDYYTKTDLYFFSLMYWKNFVNNKRWRISVPIEIGIGATKNQEVNLLNEIQIWKRKDYFMPVQAGLYIGWKATRWVGLAVCGGYRYALIQRHVEENYNGLYFSVGAELQSAIFKDTYHWIFKKKNSKK